MSLSDFPTDILHEISRKITKITDKRILSMTNTILYNILNEYIQQQENMIFLTCTKSDFKYCIDYEKANDGYYNLISANAPVTILAYCGLIEPLKTKTICSDLIKYAVCGNQPKVLLWLTNLFPVYSYNIYSYIVDTARNNQLDCLKILCKRYDIRSVNTTCYAAIPHHDCLKYLLEVSKPTDINYIIRRIIEEDSLDCFKLLENYDDRYSNDECINLCANNSPKIKEYLCSK